MSSQNWQKRWEERGWESRVETPASPETGFQTLVSQLCRPHPAWGSHRHAPAPPERVDDIQPSKHPWDITGIFILTL